ncbi:MAG TPA: GNAT family N-acetyltransferase [Tepidiformaceae bacterium]
MPRVQVRPFEQSDISDAARLLAERHRRDHARLPMLATSYLEQDGCEAAVAAHLANRRTSGALALDDGRMAGFLFGEATHLSPEHFASQYVPPYSVGVPGDGHAVDPAYDATAVYRALYGALAAGWVSEGLFTHRLYITPGDREVEEAWVSLGFGRAMTAGTRDTGPVMGDTASSPGLEIHAASSEDVEVVLGLARVLAEHHLQSPIFWPILPTTRDAVRQFTQEALADSANACFVAYLDGNPVAMQQFLVDGFTPPTVEPKHNIYLYEGVVDPAARSGGIGQALLSHSMRWARENGYERCTLHWASGNPEGAPFWLKHGFVPVEHTMSRRVDERIAWAR